MAVMCPGDPSNIILSTDLVNFLLSLQYTKVYEILLKKQAMIIDTFQIISSNYR